MNLKNRLSIAVFEQLKNSKTTDDDYSCVDLFVKMWKNTNPAGGFALTETGLDYLVNVLNLKYWNISVNVNQITSADILYLERYMLTPFYLTGYDGYDGRKKNRTLVVFDEQIATQIILYGNLQLFLQAQDAASSRPIIKN